jgi:hypothetical protein
LHLRAQSHGEIKLFRKGTGGRKLLARRSKTKTSFLGLGSLLFAIGAFVVVPWYIDFYSKYTDSLHSDKISGKQMGTFLGAWFLLSFLSIVFSFLAIILSIIKRKSKGIGTAVIGILITFFVAALVMPTLGLSHSVMYKRKANDIAHKALEEFNQTSQGGNYFLKDYEKKINYNYGKEPRIVEVIYTLKRGVEFDSFPQHFTVILNLENGKAEIQREGVLEE